MNKFSKMAALLMSAVMCAFTSCGGSDDEKNDVAAAPVAKVALMTIPETLDCVEGTMKVEFKPSGKTVTLNLSDATGKIDEEMFSVVQLSSLVIDFSAFKDKAGCVSRELKGELNDTQCVLTYNCKPKAGLELSADKKYDLKLVAPHKIVDGKGTVYPDSEIINHGGVPGDKFQTLCDSYCDTQTINFKK